MADSQTEVRFDLPVIEDDSAPWWAAVRQGRLLLEHCAACAYTYLYPRSFCPRCWSEAVTSVEAGGGGTVYSYSVVRMNDLPPFGGRVPYVVALVELDEGARLTTNVVDIDVSSVRVGMRVRFTPRELAGGIWAPFFAPDGAA